MGETPMPHTGKMPPDVGVTPLFFTIVAVGSNCWAATRDYLTGSFGLILTGFSSKSPRRLEVRELQVRGAASSF